MAAPSVLATSVVGQTTNMSVTLPTQAAGCLLLVNAGCDTTPTDPSGWDILGSGTTGGSISYRTYATISKSGSESMTLTGGGTISYWGLSIQNWSGRISDIVYVGAASVDPPAATIAGKCMDNLFVVGMVATSTGSSGAPTGYTNLGGQFINAGHTKLGTSAYKVAAATQTDDPSTYNPTSPSNPRTWTVVVPGALVIPPVQNRARLIRASHF